MERTKISLRLAMKSNRMVMDKAYVDAASARIANNLQAAVDWQKVGSMHLYLPIASLSEIDTWPLLQFIWQTYPNILTYVAPHNQYSKYSGLRIRPTTPLQLTLADSQPMPHDFQYDVVVVPVLSFDKEGYRLGWGGGWYDKFLVGQSHATTVGLAYQTSFVVTGIPHEPHDVPLSMIITEKRAYLT